MLVSPGTYLENIKFNGKSLVVGSLFITTQDTSYISQTVIDGNENGTVVTFESGEDSTAVLSGFTITKGYYKVPVEDPYNNMKQITRIDYFSDGNHLYSIEIDESESKVERFESYFYHIVESLKIFD